jgi:hypothetical protein
VGLLFDGRCKVDQIIRERKLDQIDIYGQIGLKAGLLISLIKATTPDDDAKAQKLRKAVQEVLQVRI